MKVNRIWRRSWTLAAVVLFAILVSGAAMAATLAVTSEQVTVYTSVVSIPPTTCTLSAADTDSYVSETGLFTNFGTAANLDVRSALVSNKRALAQFGLAPCSIPANSLVTAASLELYMFAAPTISRTYDAHGVTASWTESGVTWINQPAVGASATATVATGTTSNVVLTWNVTPDVQAFVDGTTVNNGWRIGDRAEGSLTSREAQFRSAEYATASQRPTLTITYYP